MLTNLRYADDTTLLAGTKEDLIELVGRVRRASEKAGLYLNVGKTKVMTMGDIGEVTVDGNDIEVVTKFVFLGAMITKHGLCEKEVQRRIAMGKAAMGGITSIRNETGVTLETKVKLVKVLVFPIVLYGAETWTMRKHDRRKIDAFELWCWRRVLRVSWMERNTNIWIIENIKPEWTLESMVPKAALSYFGHVVRAGGMEDDVMLGRMNGARACLFCPHLMSRHVCCASTTCGRSRAVTFLVNVLVLRLIGRCAELVSSPCDGVLR